MGPAPAPRPGTLARNTASIPLARMNDGTHMHITIAMAAMSTARPWIRTNTTIGTTTDAAHT